MSAGTRESVVYLLQIGLGVSLMVFLSEYIDDSPGVWIGVVFAAGLAVLAAVRLYRSFRSG
jgi:hypothetical protein